MTISRESLVESLPMGAGELEIRVMRREDLDERANWPLYPPMYESFDGSYAKMTRYELDALFHTRSSEANRLMLVADHPSEPVIVYYSLNEIDWEAGVVGNVGFRVKPTWCDRGIGTLVMRAITAWCFSRGFQSIRFDVSAVNPRAIRCYEKCGFQQVGELWRDSEGLRGIDLSDGAYDFLRSHVRFDGDMPQVRFYRMELVNDGCDH